MSKKLLCAFFLSLMLPLAAWAQSGTVSGVVTDSETGDLLAGASVFFPQLQRGDATNIDGEYRIQNVPYGTYNLRVTYVGYRTFNQSVTVESSEVTVNIELNPDLVGLDQVVVVGFGTQIKQDLTGNIARISGEELRSSPVNSIESAIQGRAAGVNITQGTGKLGQGIQMRIRGSSSVSASNEPLYIIDGVPVTTQSQSSTTATNPLADLNYADVESIEILKDASAAAIYGSRASNGVVIITTRQGQAGGTKVNYNFQTGISSPTNRTVGWLNTDEYIEFYLEAAANTDEILGTGQAYQNYIRGFMSSAAAGQLSFDANDNPIWADGVIDTDWQDQSYQDASMQRHELSVSGGDDRTRFFASGSWSDEKGILISDEFERISGRLNLDHQAKDWLNVGLNFSLARTVNTRVPGDNLFANPMQLIALPPITPVIDPRTGELSGDYTLYYNNLRHAEFTDFTTTVFRNLSNAYATAEIAPGLRFRSEFGIDLLTQNEDEYYGRGAARGLSLAANGYGVSTWVRVLNYNVNNFVNYTTNFEDIHDLELVAGTSYQLSDRERTSVAGTGTPSDDFQKIASAADITSGTSTGSRFSFLSYFARANYKFDNKYLFTVSGRVDGSSRFGVDARYGFFPAVSAGWILTEESFLQDAGPLSFLKLRASYGVTGNAEINNFAHLGLFGASSYAGQTALIPSQTPNPDLKWETTTQVDVGLDFGFFDDRLTGEIDYYVKNTEDLLLNVNVPEITGFSSQTRNVGELKNNGFEVFLNSNNLVGDFRWTTTFNIAFNRNEITNLDGQIIEAAFVNRAVEGEPIGTFFAEEYAGVNPDNGDGLFYLNREPTEAELNSGAVILFNDRYATTSHAMAERVVIGNPNPDFIGGLGNNFSYRGFDLNIFFQFSYGNDIYWGGGGRFHSANGIFEDNQTKMQLDRWQQPGDETDVPQARLFLANGYNHSSRYVDDGSYLRLKNMTFGYNLPRNVIDRVGLSSARIYATGYNLLTFTNYEGGWDPEVNTDFLAGNIGLGNDFYSAPQARTLLLGVNIEF